MSAWQKVKGSSVETNEGKPVDIVLIGRDVIRSEVGELYWGAAT